MYEGNIVMRKKILIAIIIILSILYLKFEVFNPYRRNGNLVMKNNVTYQDNPELNIKYINGDIKRGKTIGIIKGESFLDCIFITWVIKLDGFDEEETFLVKGLMFDMVYTRVDD